MNEKNAELGDYIARSNELPKKIWFTFIEKTF